MRESIRERSNMNTNEANGIKLVDGLMPVSYTHLDVYKRQPFGKIKGTEEISNVMLYIVIALIASRADLGAVGNAPIWLLAGFVILLIHVAIMIALAKILKLDIFTCCVASLANIGGTATAPVLAGAYSNALVPVGIMMALLGYVIGTGGGLVVANLMSIFG